MTAPVHVIELHADRGEIQPRLICTATPDATCRRRPTDPNVETWTDDSDTTPGHECWAIDWVDQVGFQDAVHWGPLGSTTDTLARVPVHVSYDEGVIAEPVVLPDETDALPVTADGTYRSARAGETEHTPEQAHQALAMVNRWVARHAAPAGDQRVLTDQLIYVQETLRTLIRRPDAPQPATTDDAVERAARALFVAEQKDDEGRSAAGRYWDSDYPDSVIPREHYRAQARAALAAAGAGAEVDREALREAMLRRWWMDQTGPDADRWETLDADERENVAENSYADTFLAAVLDFLAARGDAATPTEVEWGVRWPNSDVEKCGAPGTADDYEDESVAEHGGVRVQRTVSAWREVS